MFGYWLRLADVIYLGGIIVLRSFHDDHTYVTHTCKNKKCGRAFVDVDLYNAQSAPPSWKYCKSCVKEGFENVKKVKKQSSEKQLAVQAKFKELYIKKSIIVDK